MADLPKSAQPHEAVGSGEPARSATDHHSAKPGAQPTILNTHGSLPGGNPYGELGIVLTGGGSRTAYQVGALKRLAQHLTPPYDLPTIVTGSSIGALNGILFGSALKHGATAAVQALRDVWQERTYRNTFVGSPSRAFLRAIQVAILRYSSPGPAASSVSIFDPTPLRERVDEVLGKIVGSPALAGYSEAHTIAVMATVEEKLRRPLLFVQTNRAIEPAQLRGASFAISKVSTLTAAHGFASAALPSVLPPVHLDAEMGKVQLVDGGISDNFPVDPAVRLGADRLILIDASGRRWWFDHYGEPHDTRPKWEVAAEQDTFCLFPRGSLEIVARTPLGTLLKQAVGKSQRAFMNALGPTWPIFRILKHKMGEALAYEVMSYVALDPDYFSAVEELGYQDADSLLKSGFPLRSPASATNETSESLAA